MTSPAPRTPKIARCPICRKETDEAYRPFCSKRCADIDLGKWFSGGYAIAGRDDEDAEGTASETSKKQEDDEG